MPNEKLRGWATISENLDKYIIFRLKAAFQKRHGFAQSLSSTWFYSPACASHADRFIFNNIQLVHTTVICQEK